MSKTHTSDEVAYRRGCIVAVSIFLGLLILGWVAIFFGMRWLEGLPKPKRDLKDLEVALSHYRTEYQAWPDIESLKRSESEPVQVQGSLLSALLGEPSELNPKGIKFTKFRQASKGVSGLTKVGETLVLHDAWGSPYWLMLDVDHENRIPNPELFPDVIADPRMTSRAPTMLSTTCLLFSSGPDRDPKTWTDNIASWR